MARRQGYISEFSKLYPQVPHIQVDAGHLFNDRIDPNSRRLAEDVRLGNDWVIRAFDRMRVSAANVSYQDLPQLQLSLAGDQFPKLAGQYQVMRSLISANIHARAEGFARLEPFRIEQVKGARLPRPLRVGIIGLTEPGNVRMVPKEFTIENPLVAAKKIIPKVRSQCDLLIVLAYMPKPLATQLAEANPGIDVMMMANRLPFAGGPEKYGKTTLIQCTNEGKLLGELRVFVNPKGEVKATVARTINLDDAIPDDTVIADLRAQARQELSVVQERLMKANPQPTSMDNTLLGDGATPSSGRPAFVTAGSCQACHDREYQIWQESRHAHAFATLQRVRRENEQECISCHVTGLGKPTGFVNLFTTPRMKDVQCEACHTQGSFHTANPVVAYGKVTMPAGCVTCHTRENSPDYKQAEYWEKIKH